MNIYKGMIFMRHLTVLKKPILMTIVLLTLMLLSPRDCYAQDTTSTESITGWLETNIPWMNQVTWGITNWKWIGILVAIFLGLAMRLFTHSLSAFVLKLTQKTKSKWDDTLADKTHKPVAMLLAIGVWFLAIGILNFKNEQVRQILEGFLYILLSLTLIRLAYQIINVLQEYLLQRAESTETKLDNQLVSLLTTTLKAFAIVFGVLLCFQNLGFNVVSLMAGLGLGGLAIAMAAKDTLANLFGSIMIMLDKPFKVGDWIIMGKAEGTVENIGFRSTRIRTFYNSVISVPNMEIATGNVDNMGRRQYRRVREYLSLTYNTPPEKIEQFIEGIKKLIEENPDTRKDYYHVVLNKFSSSSLDILIYFFFEVPDWTQELKQRQAIFLDILKLAKRVGVNFAFPTQSLHIESIPENYID